MAFQGLNGLTNNKWYPNTLLMDSETQTLNDFISIDSQKAPELLADKFFRPNNTSRSTGSQIHRVVNGLPFFYHFASNTWKISCLTFLWGVNGSGEMKVKILNGVPTEIQEAMVDWSLR